MRRRSAQSRQPAALLGDDFRQSFRQTLLGGRGDRLADAATAAENNETRPTIAFDNPPRPEKALERPLDERPHRRQPKFTVEQGSLTRPPRRQRSQPSNAAVNLHLRRDAPTLFDGADNAVIDRYREDTGQVNRRGPVPDRRIHVTLW